MQLQPNQNFDNCKLIKKITKNETDDSNAPCIEAILTRENIIF